MQKGDAEKETFPSKRHVSVAKNQLCRYDLLWKGKNTACSAQRLSGKTLLWISTNYKVTATWLFHPVFTCSLFLEAHPQLTGILVLSTAQCHQIPLWGHFFHFSRWCWAPVPSYPPWLGKNVSDTGSPRDLCDTTTISSLQRLYFLFLKYLNFLSGHF